MFGIKLKSFKMVSGKRLKIVTQRGAVSGIYFTQVTDEDFRIIYSDHYRNEEAARDGHASIVEAIDQGWAALSLQET